MGAAREVSGVVYAVFWQVWREHNRLRVVWIGRIAWSFLFFLPLLLMGRAFGTEGFSANGGGDDFVAFAAIGIVVLRTSTRPMSATIHYLSQGNAVGVLPALWVTPAPRWALCLGASLAALVDSIIEAAIVLAAAFVVLGATGLSFSPVLFIPLLAGLTMFWGLGLVFGSLFLATRSWMAETIVTGLLFALAGAAFPIAILPWAIRWLSYALPQTYVLDALRSSVLGTPTIAPPGRRTGDCGGVRRAGGRGRHRVLPSGRPVGRAARCRRVVHVSLA